MRKIGEIACLYEECGLSNHQVISLPYFQKERYCLWKFANLFSYYVAGNMPSLYGLHYLKRNPKGAVDG